jgi:hypothetical protein
MTIFENSSDMGEVESEAKTLTFDPQIKERFYFEINKNH